MSRVTNIILVYDLCDHEREHELLAEVNALLPRGALVHVDDPALPPDWFVCNNKGLEVNIAIGAFNFLDLDAWLAAIRTKIDFFEDYGCDWAQLLVCEQEDDGFRIIPLDKPQPCR